MTTQSTPSGNQFLNAGSDEWRNFLTSLRKTNADVRAAELDPADPAPLVNRGLLYAGRGEYERAIADYDQVLKIAPEFALAHFNKARAFEQTGRPGDAIRQYRTFVEKAGAEYEALKIDARGRIAVLER